MLENFQLTPLSKLFLEKLLGGQESPPIESILSR
jgi:hypothetical protein